jgi:hypothetical protein
VVRFVLAQTDLTRYSQMADEALNSREYERRTRERSFSRHTNIKWAGPLEMIDLSRVLEELGLMLFPLPHVPLHAAWLVLGPLADVLVSKYADRCLLYRQSEIYARLGVELDRSTLAGWADAYSGFHLYMTLAGFARRPTGHMAVASFTTSTQRILR